MTYLAWCSALPPRHAGPFFNCLAGKGCARLILTRNRTTLLVECSHCTFGNGKPKRTLGVEAHIAASSSTHGRKIRKVGVSSWLPPMLHKQRIVAASILRCDAGHTHDGTASQRSGGRGHEKRFSINDWRPARKPTFPKPRLSPLFLGTMTR